uniref:Uncharacterized protein n=1 Tax=Ananas comosus var. bracteatus TaxID=296719 RepID=A0A6V7P4K6_ANACO|nr:unnamed protein product [Ananas comosus var. bracteatus]
MWNNRKQSMMVPGQGMNYHIAFDTPIPTEELRKRKATDFDFHTSFYADHLSNRESYLQQGVVAPQETNSHLRATEEFLAYNLQPATKAFNTQSQTGNSQFCNLSNLPTIMQTPGSKTLEGAIGGFNSITYNEKGSSFSSMTFPAGITNQVQCLNSDTISYGKDHANYGMSIKPHQFSATQSLNNDAISHGNYDSNNISVDHLNIRYREQSHTIIQETVSSKPINNEQLSLSCERVENIGQSFVNSLTETSEKNGSKSKDAYSSEEVVTKQIEIGNKLPSQNEPTKLAAGQLSPIIAEKLWDGSLQLNTSTMVSALAFFKRFLTLIFHILTYSIFRLHSHGSSQDLTDYHDYLFFWFTICS